jgi:hypothetical protein
MNLALMAKQPDYIYNSYSGEILIDLPLLICSQDGSNVTLAVDITTSSPVGRVSCTKEVNGVVSTSLYTDTSISGRISSACADASLSNICLIETFGSSVPKLRFYSYSISTNSLTLKQVTTLPDANIDTAMSPSMDLRGTSLVFHYQYSTASGITGAAKRRLMEYNLVSGTWTKTSNLDTIQGLTYGRITSRSSGVNTLLAHVYNTTQINCYTKSGSTWTNVPVNAMTGPVNSTTTGYGSIISTSYVGAYPEQAFTLITDTGWVSSTNTSRRGYCEVRNYSTESDLYSSPVWSIDALDSVFNDEDSFFSIFDAKISKNGNFIYIQAYKYVYVFIKQSSTNWVFMSKFLSPTNSFNISETGQRISIYKRNSSYSSQLTLSVI